MEKQNKELNAGVHATTGFEFQKHCALYIIMDDFEYYNSQEYYLYFEHHEDFLFCFLNNENLISEINLYQAKKKTEAWSSSDLKEVILSMCDKSQLVKSDQSVTKAGNIEYLLHFISNEFIKLETIKINESRTSISYKALPLDDKNKIKELVNSVLLFEEFKDKNKHLDKKKLTTKEAAKWHKDLEPEDAEGLDRKLKLHPCWQEIEGLHFVWVDLNKTSEAQRNALIGKIHSVFGNQISDPSAAFEALMLLFRDIENTFNQGSAKLSDNKKRIHSNEVQEAMNILTHKSMAYDYWRGNKVQIAKSFNLNLVQKSKFEALFDNSFDLFKDLMQVEHQQILKYTGEHKEIMNNVSSEDDFVIAISDSYKKTYSTRLSEIDLKAAFYAAYFLLLHNK